MRSTLIQPLMLSAACALLAPMDAARAAPAMIADDPGLALPPGFTATIFADHVGHARHMVVAPDGTLYVNTWSGAYYDDANVPRGGFLVALRDTNGDGKADAMARFGATLPQGDHGGTGIALYGGKLYAETNDKIVRYDIQPDSLAPTGKPVTVLSGLPLTGDHPMHPFSIDKSGALYVDLGSATNACQAQNRVAGSPGLKPCVETQTRGGIWRYDANKTNQTFSASARFATGLRNRPRASTSTPPAASSRRSTAATSCSENWSDLYSPDQGHDLPAERAGRAQAGRRLRLAAMLFRQSSEEARAGAGIWR